MGKKKGKGHKKPMWKKVGGAVVTGVGAAVGGIVALSPIYRGLRTLIGGSPEQAAADIVFDTTGISGGSQPDVGKMVSNVVIAGVGIGIAFGARYIARTVFR